MTETLACYVKVYQPASVPALLAVPAAIPAASIPVSAPPFPLSATAAGGGPAVVAVLLVSFSYMDSTAIKKKVYTRINDIPGPSQQ